MLRARSALAFAVVSALAIVLSSCASPSGGSTSSPSSTLSFTVDVPSNAAAWVTVEKSDGSVFKSASVPVGSHQVSFQNVPTGAVVTASMKGPMGLYNSTTGKTSTFTEYSSASYLASTVAGQAFYFYNPTNYSFTISGPCPSNSTASTKVTPLSYQQLDAYGLYYDRYFTAMSCVADSSYASGFGFTGTVYVPPTSQQTDGAYSVSLIAFDSASSGQPITAYALKLDQLVPGQSVTFTASDWHPESAMGTNTAHLTMPAVPSNETAGLGFDVAALHKGQPLPLQRFATQFGGSSVTSVTTSAPYIPYVASQYEMNQDYLLEFNGTSGGQWSSAAIRHRTLASLPIGGSSGQSLSTSDFWPLITDLRWSTSGGLNETFTPNTATKSAAFAYAYVQSWDFQNKVYRFWEDDAAVGAGTSGKVAYPELPASLSAYVPVPSAASNGGTWAHLSFSSYDPLTGQAVPSSYDVVVADANGVVATAGLPSAGTTTPSPEYARRSPSRLPGVRLR